MRNKMIELIKKGINENPARCIFVDELADHLIANGVTIATDINDGGKGIIDLAAIKKAIEPKANSTLNNMKKADLIDYIRCLENNYNTAVWFNENQAKYVESLKLPKWIPVSERLPDIGVSVLMHYKSGLNMTAGFLVDVDEDRTMWCAYTDDGFYTDCDYEPTHWMPLPEPPKEEL